MGGRTVEAERSHQFETVKFVVVGFLLYNLAAISLCLTLERHSATCMQISGRDGQRTQSY